MQAGQWVIFYVFLGDIMLLHGHSNVMQIWTVCILEIHTVHRQFTIKSINLSLSCPVVACGFEIIYNFTMNRLMPFLRILGFPIP